MAPLSPDNTPRFKVTYTVNGFEHDFQLRSHASPTAVGAIVDAFLTAIQDSLYLLTIIDLQFAADASNIFLPVDGGIAGNAYSIGSAPLQESMWFYGFQGRSAGGRKWHLDVFGARTLGTDYRLAPGENADVSAGVTSLQSAAPNIVGIDDAVVTVYTYVNCGVNAHWQRAVRS